MLSKSRMISFLLLTVGVALLVAGLVAPRFIHEDARLPLDLSATTWTLKDENARARLMTDPDGRVLDVPVTHQLHMDIQNPVDADTATLRVGETFMRGSHQEDLDRLISAEVWTFAVDRVTGRFTTPATLTDQLASPVTEVDIDGIWLAFPSDAEREPLEVLDPALRATRPAEFAEELEMNGRTIDRWRQEIPPTNVTELVDAPPVPLRDGAEGFLFHAATRDFLVDRVSGLVVEIRESVDDYLGTVDGEKREQVLLFDGRMDQAQIDEHLRDAAAVRSPGSAEVLRWSVVGLGAVLVLLGLVGSFGVFSRSEKRRGDAS